MTHTCEDPWPMPVVVGNGIQSMPKASEWNELQKQLRGKGYTQQQMKSMYTGMQTQEVGAEKSARADAARSNRPATASSSSGTNFQKYYYYSRQLMSGVNALGH